MNEKKLNEMAANNTVAGVLCDKEAPEERKNSCIKKRLPVVKTAYRNLGNDGVAGKMLRWSILSDSPNSYAVKA